jgi:hypothetical protein
MFSSSRFTNIVVKWPGSTHDSFILNNSGIPDAMTGINGWLLGDSGYPLKKWLMTPLITQPTYKSNGITIPIAKQEMLWKDLLVYWKADSGKLLNLTLNCILY